MKKIFLLIFLFFLFGCSSEEIIIENGLNESNTIYVNVTGKVKFPGIYQLQEQKYLYEVIELAGGFLKDANKDNLNLVQLIDKDCTINIMGNNLTEDNGLININYASINQLTILPGIGEAYAKNIIEYRELNGMFLNKEDIMNVPGIKGSVFEKIKNFFNRKQILSIFTFYNISTISRIFFIYFDNFTDQFITNQTLVVIFFDDKMNCNY